LFPAILCTTLFASRSSRLIALPCIAFAIFLVSSLAASATVFLADPARSPCSPGHGRRPHPPLACLLLAALMLWRISGLGGSQESARNSGFDPLAALSPGTATASARILRDSRLAAGGIPMLELEITQIEGSRGVRVSAGGLSLTCQATASAYRGQRVQMEIESRIQPDGGFVVVAVPGSIIIQDSSGFSAARMRILQRVDGNLRAQPLKIRNYVRAVVLGDRSGLGTGLTGIFRQAGLMHMLVLSGFHLGIMYVVVRKLLPGVFGPFIRELLSLTAVWGFIWMVGPGPSAYRAAVSISIHAMIRLSGWRISSDHQLAIIWMLMLAIVPRWARDMGTYLSFAAIWGLSQLSGPLELLLHRLNYRLATIRAFHGPGRAGLFRRIAGIILPSVAAQLAVAPLTLVFFSTASPQGIAATPVILPLFYLSIALSTALLLIPAGLPAIGLLISRLLSAIIRLIEILCIPFAAVGSWIDGVPMGILCFGMLVIWALMAWFILDCSRSGLLVSCSHVELRLGGGTSALPAGPGHGNAEKIRTELHDQSVGEGKNRIADAAAGWIAGLGGGSRARGNHQADA
jgi:ComEC/Rec2-related protein